MNDNIFFPDMNGKKILLDDVAKYSITLPEKAEMISEIIKKNFSLVFPDYNANNLTITDAMACVGGNTLSFSNHFKNVIANEINVTRYQYLMNNMNEYQKKNIVYYNDNYLNLIKKLKQDIVFIDPPWGGPIYKSQYKMDIALSNDNKEDPKDVKLHELINELFSQDNTKMIIFKLPINHDRENFQNKIYKNKMICLKNMMLIMVFNKIEEDK